MINPSAPDPEEVLSLVSKVEEIKFIQGEQHDELTLLAVDVAQLEKTTNEIQDKLKQIEKKVAQ